MRLLLLLALASLAWAYSVVGTAYTTSPLSAPTNALVRTFTLYVSARPVTEVLYDKGLYTLYYNYTAPYTSTFTLVCSGTGIAFVQSPSLEMSAALVATTYLNVKTVVVTNATTYTAPEVLSEVLTPYEVLVTKEELTSAPASTTVAAPKYVTLEGNAAIVPYSTLVCTYNTPPTVTLVVGPYTVVTMSNAIITVTSPFTLTGIMRTPTVVNTLATFPVVLNVSGTVTAIVYAISFQYEQFTTTSAVPLVGLPALWFVRRRRQFYSRGK